MTPATERVAARHGLTLVYWTIDTHDWRGDAAAEMIARARGSLVPGAVVLMHDALGPGALRAGAQNTLDLIAPLVATARERGLTVGALAPIAALDRISGAERPAQATRLPALVGGR